MPPSLILSPAATLSEAVVATHSSLPDDLVRRARDRIDPAWVEAALAEGGAVNVRRRKMPAQLVVWLVLGVCLFAGSSFVDIVKRFGLVAPTARGTPQDLPGSGSIAEARKRLGAKAMESLFRIASGHWRSLPSLDHLRFRGLQVCGVDGFTCRVPDTESNRKEFGKPSSRRGESAYPQARVLCVVDVVSHMVLAATVGGYREGELSLFRKLVADLPGSAVYVGDRNFNAYADLYRLQSASRDRHWLVRAKGNVVCRLVRSLGHGDDLVELSMSHQMLKADPELPRTFLVRRITYRVGKTERTVLTSMLDPVRFPAREVAGLYRSRWEVEMVFDDIKTEQRDASVALRSKLPDGVRQEIFGLLLAHNLVRIEMAAVAEELKVPPTRISFHRALERIAQHFRWFATDPPTKLPEREQLLRNELKYMLLPERRARLYPRAVKVFFARYPRKVIGQPQEGA